MRNAIGREIPDRIDGRELPGPYTGPFDHLGAVTRASVRLTAARPGRSKLLPSIRAALQACELRDGATISFHHHLRNGDHVLNAVLDEVARMGLRDIRIAAARSSPSTRRSSGTWRGAES